MKIKRREFLILSSILGLSSTLSAEVPTTFEKAFKEVVPLVKAVQAHLFPEGGDLPSSDSMGCTKFLFDTINHFRFDKDIRAFVLEGAKELNIREKGKFLSMTSEEKEKALRSYEDTRYGKSWLSRIMTLTMEGMFCDPIYGSNIDKKAWKALGHNESFPRPKEKYLGLSNV
ncbi:Tat (Twin-arginine translocation) pathway signal sequence domain protein [hydrothermal vent metagenome]|uniref:Tat (Twin-arginine translocation) pathway signal sequence domain protein n=1 Tax=hydrothermal vent metagenome TaxID=652676 RepID=A0A1W1CLL3_9ZZZZ